MKYVKISFISIFMFICLFMFSSTIINNNEISTLEKRSLQTFPKFTINSFLDNSYFDKLTTAFSDQLGFRNYFIKGYFLFQFQRYNGDVVKGKNGDLYSSYQDVSNKEEYLNELKDVSLLINNVASEVNAEFIFLSIPRKDAVETSNLPNSYLNSKDIYLESVNTIKSNLSSDITFIDGYDIFMNDKHQNRYYYLTDHHITPRGAMLLYTEIINKIDNKDVLLYDISNYEVGETIIKGSFNKQLGQSVKTGLEELYLVPKYNINYVRYEDEVISDLKIFDNGNSYGSSYMKGDKAYTVIDTNRSNLPNILYVGSSFTNILEALSYPSFNKVVSIDYRHNKSGNSIKYYVDKYDIDYVVFVPSQSSNAFSISFIKTHLGL